MLVVLLSALSWGAWGGEIVVSTDGTGAYRSIQRAVDVAAYGDVIVVNPGIYEEYVVLKSGITLRGAGASHTIVRSSYGYEPVLRASHVGSVVVESLSIERATSILDAAVVGVEASNLVFRDCRIAGGQLGGVSSDGASRLSFVRCTIEKNLGYGVQISAGEDIRFQDCLVSDNGSAGILASDSMLTVERSEVSWNETDGVRLSGASRLTCRASDITHNGGWGIELTHSSSATFDDCTFETQALGNLRASDTSSAVLTTCTVRGGRESAVVVRDTATVKAIDTRITRASGDGVRVTDAARLTLEHATVALCSEDGVSVYGIASCQLAYVTLAYNGGNGFFSQGRAADVSGSIIAVNGAFGIRVNSSAGTPSDARFAFNNVWGNESGDYEGIRRPSSDISEPPEFADPNAGDFSLSLTSANIDAGPLGTTLGAWGNPRWSSGGRFGITLQQAVDGFGSLSLSAGWEDVAKRFATLDARWMSGDGVIEADASLSWKRLSRLCSRATIAYAPESPIELSDWLLQPRVAAGGVADGAASYWQVSGSIDIQNGGSHLSMSSVYECPTGVSHQAVDATWGCLTLSSRAIDFALADLSVSWTPILYPETQPTDLSLRLDLLPEQRLSAGVGIHSGDSVLHVEGSAFLEQIGTSSATIAWADASTRASVTVRLREGAFEDVEATAGYVASIISLSGSLGANAVEGPRIRLDVALDTGHWLSPEPNEPPVPGFSVNPPEPEAGELLVFDASHTSDPDGTIDQIWWDFGDGSSAIGSVVEHAYPSPGTYTVVLTVSDDDGAVTTLVDALTVREPASTPVAAFTWSPVSSAGTRLPRDVRAGDRVLLDAADAHDPNGSIEEYSWDLQSDGTFDLRTSEPRTVIDPLPAGAWPVTLRVVDADGNTDAVMHVLTVADLRPPEAGFEMSPPAPAVGDPIRFIDNSASIDGTLISWEWDFGDGVSSREQEPMHRYESAGTYEIYLTVRDSEGLSDAVSVTVTVLANPELVPVQQVWAVLIGIADYDEVPDLSYASRDATALADWLSEQGVIADHIRLLTDTDGTHVLPTGESLAVQPATLLNVRAALGWLRDTAERDDLVLIHFSGHGYQGADDNLDEADGVDEFFVLKDTRASAKDDTALRDDEFGRFLDRIASDHVLVFFDSCYSGGLSRSLVPGARATGEISDVFGDFQLQGRLILSASQESQDAFESPQLEHGVLTHFLLEGLAGSADLNEDGHVTAWELFGYVRDAVPPFVASERGETQIPQLIGEGESRIVLAQSPATMPLTFFYQPAVPFAGAPVRFRSESVVEVDDDALNWDFGDGVTASGRDVAHAYAAPGTYRVQHTRIADANAVAKTLDLVVAPRASVASVDDSGRVVITVGAQHGVVLGDCFRPAATSEGADDDIVPILEVVEILDATSSACAAEDSPHLPKVGDALLPVLDGADAPRSEGR